VGAGVSGEIHPLAEETGLIVPIGERVLRAACLQNRSWQDQGIPPFPVSVNISARQFQQPDLRAMITRVLREAQLDPRWLELELTESLLMADADRTIATLGEVHAMGIGLAMDDFGIGYSSLSYLKRFPIDTIKIDQSFVRHVTSDADDAAISAAIIAMAHSLNLTVVAEGVETDEQLSFLEREQCDAIQGYLVSPPRPAEEITTLLRAKTDGDDPRSISASRRAA
jgi:EAL domain-containing protein (putative c-di-GMP-specific phosphodiesterase class I)